MQSQIDNNTATLEIRHQFYIRHDFKTDIYLPSDLTQEEAEKIGVFLKSLAGVSEDMIVDLPSGTVVKACL